MLLNLIEVAAPRSPGSVLTGLYIKLPLACPNAAGFSAQIHAPSPDVGSSIALDEVFC